MSSTDLEASSNGPNLNVLLIIVDDLRPALGSYEDPLALTPNTDRLSSVRYRQVIVSKIPIKHMKKLTNQAVCVLGSCTLA